MNTLQINAILNNYSRTRRYYRGCFAADQISNNQSLEPPIAITRYPYAFVVNVDESHQPGSHWIAIFVCSPSRVEYFDSLASTPTDNYHIGEYLKQFPIVAKNSKFPLQNPFSNVCGQFCIYFIINRCEGISFDDIVKFLYRIKNADVYVRNFVNMLLSK